MDRTYLLPVLETVSLAWEKTRGAKGCFWGAYGWIGLITFVLGVVEGIMDITSIGVLAGFAGFLKAILPLISSVLLFGILRMGVRRALDQAISARMVFYPITHFMLLLKLIGFWLLFGLVILVPIAVTVFALSFATYSQFAFTPAVLLAIATAMVTGGIALFLMVRIRMGWGFILDKEVSAWQAMKLSYQVTRHNFWRLAGLYLLNCAIVAISAIPLGIGLIWTIPYVQVNYGVVYRQLMETAA